MTYVNPSLQRAIAQRWKLVDSLRPLPPEVVASLGKVFRTEFTYNTNALEGNTLTLRETQLILEEGQTVGGKSLREVYEARNHPEAIGYVESLASDARRLSVSDVLTLHQIVMKDAAGPGRTGVLRRGEVRISGSRHVPPPAYEVPRLMDALVDDINDNPDERTTVEQAAVVLHGLVHVHPFYDGNGRVARLLANLVLMRRRYQPIVVLKQDRRRYLTCLEKADAGDLRPICAFVAQYELKHLDMVLRAVEQTPGARLLSLEEAAERASTSAGYLRLLANKGYIPAVKDGRGWAIAEGDLDAYARARRKRRAPKRPR
ncbi:MAG: Fic family protein [Nitrososphaerota archaeon]|nr:Fic family protein [Nitrososphaerota archaeon]